jgi:hypothetical protein
MDATLEHQPADAGQGQVGRRRPATRPRRMDATLEHQPADAGQGQVGRMPSLAV